MTMSTVLMFARCMQLAFGLTCLGMTAIGFVGTLIYETFVPPTDMHFAGLLTAVMIVYILPAGVMLNAVSVTRAAERRQFVRKPCH